jgi:hypothetical protein
VKNATRANQWARYRRPNGYVQILDLVAFDELAGPSTADVRAWHFSYLLELMMSVHWMIYSSVAEDENHVRLVTALKSGRLSGECGLGMRIGCERPVANSKLLLERNLLEGRHLNTGAYCG